MRRNISNVLFVIGAPLFGSTLAPRRSIAFWNSAGTWSHAPGKQFGVLGRWRDRHTRPARWSDTLRIRPVRWRKWNRIRIDLARLADPIVTMNSSFSRSLSYRDGASWCGIIIFMLFNLNINSTVYHYHYQQNTHIITIPSSWYHPYTFALLLLLLLNSSEYRLITIRGNASMTHTQRDTRTL